MAADAATAAAGGRRRAPSWAMCADRGGLGGGEGDDDDEEDDEEDDDTTHFESTPNVWDSLDPLVRDSLEDLHTPSDLHTSSDLHTPSDLHSSSERVAAGVLGTARDGGGAHRSPQAPSRASFAAPYRAPIEPKEANGLLQGALSMYTWHAVSSATPAPGTAPSAPPPAAAGLLAGAVLRWGGLVLAGLPVQVLRAGRLWQRQSRRPHPDGRWGSLACSPICAGRHVAAPSEAASSAYWTRGRA